MDQNDEIVIVDPAGRLAGGSAPLAQRRLGQAETGPSQKAAIGILHNSKENADVLMRELATMLRRKYGVDRVVFAGKSVPGEPVSEEQIEMLSHCSVVLNGSGD